MPAKVRTLRQTAVLPATPHDVYEALLDPKRHAKFSGTPASLSRRAGGAFSHYGGALEGFVLFLEKDRRIVEAWRANSWAKGHYSIAEYLLSGSAQGTRVEFSQYGVPTAAFQGISDGWRKHYWTALRRHFAADRPTTPNV